MNAVLVAKVLGGLLVARVALGAGGGMTIRRYIAQGDRQWSYKTLGLAVSDTIGLEGCFLCSLTMALNALRGEDLGPDDVQTGLIAAGGCFIGPELVLARAADQLELRAPESERIHSGTGTPAKLRQRAIDTLARGGLPIFHVAASANAGGRHFILCHGRQGGRFICADPAGGADVFIDENTLSGSGRAFGSYNVVGVAPVYRG